MANPGLSDEQCIAALLALAEYDGDQTAAASSMGKPRSTFANMIKRAKDRGLDRAQIEATPIITEDDLLDLPPASEVLERARRYSTRSISAFEAEKTLRLKVKEPVFAAWFMGDPHLDSTGCDWPQVHADLDAVKRGQESNTILAVNIGDTLDHWPTGGRLAKKLADGHLSAKEALSLARWLCRDTVDWTTHILGNHDEWAGLKFKELMKEWTPARVVDWGLVIEVETKWREWKIAASHDFPGHSHHNALHALMRRSREEGGADLYVAGHRHSGGQGKVEDGHRLRTYNMMRVRGYKRADEYAHGKGYSEQVEGCSGLAVFNSQARMQDGEIRTFYDIEEGLDWMRFLKERVQ